ncbi:GspH/FimT family pseudopilin [Paucibacter sp. XJ19-41]|uniref:GspH/FimT family pseudopilin n=1 Tax=Paucibacter sp. XJ19-41 TaxID=2927824 RepID=UPI00234AF422|nr:GspH/FimT family pseudopilin [Paucibacter sp. XJ19-41]MDC6166067.1 GspH/FimT family pseudopilin [Paucibacter sp. XJ19-41]
MDALRTSKASSQRGLTLIELVVVLTLIGLSMAVLVPEAGAWIRNLSVRNAGESVRAGIEKARLEALRRNAPMSFWLVSDTSKALSDGCSLSGTGPSWVVSGSSPAGKCGAAVSETVDPQLVDKWSAADGSSGVELKAVDEAGAAVSSVTFNSLGQAVAGGSQIVRIDVSHSTSGARALRVVIQAGGSVRLCDPAASGDDPRRC